MWPTRVRTSRSGTTTRMVGSCVATACSVPEPPRPATDPNGYSVSASRSRLTPEPGTHGLAQRTEVAPQAVIGCDLDDGALLRGWRDPERVAGALDDERRHRDRVELGQAARRRRATRRLQREREAEHGDGARRLDGAAGHPRAGRAPAHEERHAAESSRAEMLADGDPGGVQRAGRRGTPAPGVA